MSASLSILAVDDSPSIRQMVAFTTTSAGHRCITAADGAEALRLAASGTFDIVITDQNMPVMDGLTLVRNLRVQQRYRSVPILVLTTETDASMRAKGRDAGATGWLTKPFDPDTLLEVLSVVWSRIKAA